MESATERPRFRNDLVAQPIEEEGIRYVNVTDPLSGSTFRFYDVEYAIACAMDGDRDLGGLADWTRAELGIETSVDELAGVVSTLQDLGYLEAAQRAAEALAGDTAPMPDASAADVAAAYDQAIELGPPGRSDLEPAKAKASGGGMELGPPGALAPAPGPSVEPAAVELGPPGAGGRKPPRSPAETSFEGLLDEVQPVALAPGTSVATPIEVEMEATQEELVVDLSAHAEIDKSAKKALEVHELPEEKEPAPPPPARAVTPPPRLSAPLPAVKPIEVARRPSAPVKAQPAPGSSIITWVILLVLLAGAVALYVFRDQIFGSDEYSSHDMPPGAAPAAPPAHKAVEAAAIPAAAPAAADKAAPAVAPTPVAPDAPAAVLHSETAAASASITAPSDGAIEWIVADGKDLQAGDYIIKLRGYKPVQDKLEDANWRLHYFQQELEKAKAQNNAAAVTAAQAKIDEKTKTAAQAEAALAPLVARAPQPGKVKLRAKLGQQVSAGGPIAELSAVPASVLQATFEATGYQVGASCLTAAKAARDQQFACVVESVEGGKVTVRLAPDAKAAKDGDELVLVSPGK